MKHHWLVNFILFTVLLICCQKFSYSEAQTVTGFLLPKTVHTVGSPMNTIVDRLYVKTGEFVKKGDSLIRVRSVKLKSQVSENIVTYFQKKKTRMVQFQEMQHHRQYSELEIKPRKQYELETIKYEKSVIDYQNASAQLSILLGAHPKLLERIRATQPDNTSEIQSILKHAALGTFYLKSPTDGMVLLPQQAANCHDTMQNCRLSEGYHIKAAENVLSIAQTNGRMIRAYVRFEALADMQFAQTVKITHPSLQQPVTGQVARIGQPIKSMNPYYIPIQIAVTDKALDNLPFESSVQILFEK